MASCVVRCKLMRYKRHRIFLDVLLRNRYNNSVTCDERKISRLNWKCILNTGTYRCVRNFADERDKSPKISTILRLKLLSHHCRLCISSFWISIYIYCAICQCFSTFTLSLHCLRLHFQQMVRRLHIFTIRRY